ncbi:hypothetical protein KYK30_31715 [Shinella yambaruensis]|uniref:Uncharacterized protein n=1 Tax=Shinella yambaruensis TaxID=415996 RepID=A0ABQ5ZVK7_9HYPH|nr:hypothetical protein [Shinella yambaruensis]MCJ8030001.1 hypothetical protein [Shinella yambaruensis]MCU7984293.1 hypothetical protein [Shinella yambaruensis]GLR55121.1 hypothetical protein GCM10007923_63420 [Shinella yambaruensis]
MIAWPKVIMGVAIAGALIWLYAEIRAGGARDITSKFERRNNDARNAADDARSAYDRCLDGGGLWNFGAGRCDGPAPRRGD